MCKNIYRLYKLIPIFVPLVFISYGVPLSTKKKQTFRTLNSDEYVRAVPELKVQEIDICSEYCNVQQRVELRNMVCHKYVLIKSLLKDVDTLCSKMDFKHKHIEYAVDKNRKIVLKNIQSSKKLNG